MEAHTPAELEPALSAARRLSRTDLCLYAVLALVLLGSLALKLYNLGHPAIKPLDESFHAIVARNLLKHPLTPTLVDRPYLPISDTDWLQGHIWLHKPILSLWQIAASYAVLGVDTFALRFPSALLSTLAAFLTFLIGKELTDRTAAFVAAAIQAFMPVIVTLTHGYLFSDHIDVALLFWVELAVYFLVRAMRTGRWSGVVLAGVAQGLAFLAKTYPALIVSGVAMAAWLLPLVGLGRRQDTRIRGRHVLVLLGVTLLTIAPWTLYTAIRWPEQFRAEHGMILSHLNQNIEGWQAPWDRLLFEHCASIYHVFYTAVLSAALLLLVQGFVRRQMQVWLLLAWAGGVILPHMLASSKPPAATITAVPAMLLLLGYMISRALAGDPWALGAWLGAIGATVLFPREIDPPRFGPGPWGEALSRNTWMLWHVAGAMACAGALAALMRVLEGRRAEQVATVVLPLGQTMPTAVSEQGPAQGTPLPSEAGSTAGRGRGPAVCRWAIIGLALAGTLYLGGLFGQAGWKIGRSEKNKSTPTFQEIGRFASERLPENAAILVVGKTKQEQNLLMFVADRSCYACREEAAVETNARQIIAAGGIPYLLSDHTPSLPATAIYTSRAEGRTLYALTAAGQQLRPARAGAAEAETARP